MPRGTRHELEGLLLRNRSALVLRVSDGGEWRLDCRSSLQAFAGRKVTVCGTRDGFDLLAVESAWLSNGGTQRVIFTASSVRADYVAAGLALLLIGLPLLSLISG